MGDAKKGYEKAGGLIKVLAWIGMILSALITAAVSIPLIANGKVVEGAAVGVAVLVFTLLLGWFQLFLGQSVKEHKDWARVVAVVLYAIQLVAFPIGTVIGAYILYQLWKGWDEPAPVAAG